MSNLLILGAGGFGHMVYECARQSGKYEEIAFLDDAAKDVLERVGTEVADVGEVVDGRPARVEADRVVRQRDQGLDAAGEGVVDVHFHGRIVYYTETFQ